MHKFHFFLRVATKIAQAVVILRSSLSSYELTSQLIKFINPILVTEKDYVEIEPFEFEEEQQSVAKLVHLVKGADSNLTLQILNLFKEKFLEGEIRRMKYTLPSFVFRIFSLIRDMVKKGEAAGAKELVYLVKNLIDILAKDGQAELSLRLFVNCSLCVNEFDESKEVKFIKNYRQKFI